MSDLFLRNLKEHQQLFENLTVLSEVIDKAIDICSTSIKNGGKILLCGNGGSAADCQHIAAEFTGRFIQDRPPIAAIALTTDSSALTCIPNDYSFDLLFARQIQALGNAGDCLIAISTSGNSKNIINALKCANSMNINTIGLLGNKGGAAYLECDTSIVVPSSTTARIQEAHILIAHTLCGGVEQRLGLFISTEI